MVSDQDEEIRFLRETLKIYEQRHQEYRAMLDVARAILTNKKHTILLRKDDEFTHVVEKLVEKLVEHGIGDNG
jgi:hypothetical protein